jgi:F420H(2)-dependent quinone reductase
VRLLYVLLNRVVNRILRTFGAKRVRGARILYLTTTGRKSGKARIVPLAFVRDGGDFVAAASNGGSDWEPAWWLNLQAGSGGIVEVDGQRVEVTATEVEDEDRARLWRLLSDQLDSYDGYQEKVRRRIAVVRLTPVGT